jgi:4-hydroxybenzoate polyprenyltransferase
VRRLLPLLRLLRIGTLFSPAADVLASFCIAGLPWQATAARAVFASVALYAAGMVWNDIADRKLDARQRPERPLPRGDLSLAFAVALGSALLLGGLLLSPCRGHHGLIAALVLAYDFAGKRIEWLGALVMGSLRGLNLLTAFAVANAAGGPGLLPEAATALWIAAGCYAIYITAVTMLGIFEDTPRVAARAVSTIQAAPPLAALAGIFAVQGGFWPAPAIALLPVLWFARRNRNQRQWDQAAIRASMTFLLLGTMVYTALLALAAQQPWVSLGIAASIAPARWISRRIALT